MPHIHRDHSPSPHRARSPLCILLVRPLSLFCSSSMRRSRELCAGAGHYAGPVTPHFPKTIEPRSAAMQERGHGGQRFSALPPKGRTTRAKARTPHPPHPHPWLPLHSPTLGWGAPGGQRGLPKHSTNGSCLPARSCPPGVTPNK